MEKRYEVLTYCYQIWILCLVMMLCVTSAAHVQDILTQNIAARSRRQSRSAAALQHHMHRGRFRFRETKSLKEDVPNYQTNEDGEDRYIEQHFINFQNKHNEKDRENCSVKLSKGANVSFPDVTNLENVTYPQLLKYFEKILCHLYEPWSSWKPCNQKCQQMRVRKCRTQKRCGRRKLRERRRCYQKGGMCSPSHEMRTPDDGAREIALDNDRLLQRYLYEVLYTPWSPWGACTRSCKQRRRRKCIVDDVCKGSFIQEARECGELGTRCHRRSKKNKHNHNEKGTDDDYDNDAEDEGGKGYTLSVDKVDDIYSDGYDELEKPDGNRKSKPKPRKKKKKKDDSDQTTETYFPSEDEHDWDKEIREYEISSPMENTTEAEDVLGAGLLDTCGIRPRDTRGSFRVIGGREAHRLSWPWQVALLTRWKEQYCGGTIVAPQWMMTAAHCVRKKGRRRRFIIRVGEHNLEEYEGSEDDIRPEVEYPHPEFDSITITNDIALVRLRKPVPVTAYQPEYACLPTEDFTPDRDSLCHILGWGKRRNTHLFGAESLFEVEVPIVKHKRCQKVFEYEINNHTQICAGHRKGGRDACAGDSGGPLLCPKTDRRTGQTRWYLAGITSYGEGCGRKGKYGIYTRVASYRQWIADIVNNYEEKHSYMQKFEEDSQFDAWG